MAIGQFPCNLGAADDTLEQIRLALSEELRSWGLNVNDGESAEIELTSDAMVLAFMWAVNERIGNQALPLRMIDHLPVWETIMQLRPVKGQGDNARRAAVAARMRGFGGNAFSTDMTQAAATEAGGAWVESRKNAEADTTSYWPGINPGPPGFEYASNRAHVAFVLNSAGIELGQFIDLRDRVAILVDQMRPDWLTFEVGTNDTGDGFKLGVSIVGQDLL